MMSFNLAFVYLGTAGCQNCEKHAIQLFVVVFVFLTVMRLYIRPCVSCGMVGLVLLFGENPQAVA